MKKLLLSCLFMLFTCVLFAQDKQAIAKVMDGQRQAWNRGDIDAFMQSYWKSDSLAFIGKTGPVYGWKTTLENYRKHYPDKAAMGTLTFKIIKIDVLDKNNAFVIGGWNLKRAKKPIGGYYTLLFRKINGQWKIVVDHTS